ncbi:hypothetical protein LTR66_002982 [Elasticomyces elasticus]|nr:hypothetical protein LTR66_002982 [Elasticomyces elasticus]
MKEEQEDTREVERRIYEHELHAYRQNPSLSRAMHLTTTGSTYPATSPLFGTLFSETIPDASAVLPRALEIAEEIVKNTSTVSTYLMRELMYRGPDGAEKTHLLDSKILYELISGSDNKEGVRSFLEKRPARFTGTMEKDAPAAYPWWDPVDVGVRAKAVKAVDVTKSKL